ncbi:type I restriction-modification system subunit M [Butyrivibrio sp. LC3010]|uniref:type I restriction-modification system subunit M n=1 Tax=Butyrivibrio sp. LC3010 TaxID=1280680 RepID=UPI00041FBB02|nr:type I restriction-modification system subunit M [Butyrivibrio sp. LC3010]
MAINTEKVQQQAADLSAQLWAIANDLRGGMDANEFRNYILGTIFYRYLSERTELYMQEILKEDNLSYEEAFTNDDFRPVVEQWSIEHLGYIIKPENLFRELNRKIIKPTGDADKFSIEDYERAVNQLTGSTLGHRSELAFKGLFDDMRLQDTRLGDTVSERTDKIGKVIAKIGEIDMDLHDQEFDVLGTAYMILIGLFQSGAGKKGGEFFTPVGPSTLCATLASLGLDEAKTVGDCTCGSGSMLLDVRKHLTTGKVGHFYGQENNPTTYNLARMNMLMHGVDYQNFDINKGDTLTNDLYGDDLKLTVQVCNPPYSLKWDANSQLLDDPRYSGVSKLAPKSHADFAFVQHMVYHMDDDDGRVAVLLPHGVLFRGGAEEEIRKWLVNTVNRLDAVIGLPEKLFHGTQIPVCILVLKSKRNGNSDNIFFIDASKDFIKGKNQNELSDEHIKHIVDAYAKREDEDKFAHKATMDEIIANDYNLNIPRYVDTSEKEENIDIPAVTQSIKDISSEISAASSELEKQFKELGLEFPF